MNIKSVRSQPDRSAISFGGQQVTGANINKPYAVVGKDPIPVVGDLLAQVQARRERAVVADTGAKLIGHYRPGQDVVLDPDNPHSHRLNVLGEIKSVREILSIVSALMPSSRSLDAREQQVAELSYGFLSDAMQKTWQRGERFRNGSELYRIVNESKDGELGRLLKHTRSAGLFIQDKDPKLLDEVRAYVSKRVKWVKDLDQAKGPTFSWREWAKNADQKGTVFINEPAGSAKSSHNMTPVLTRMAMSAVLDQRSGAKKPPTATAQPPTWFFIGDLNAMKPVPRLVEAMRELQAANGRVVIGLSSLEQLRKNYNKFDAITIADHAPNRLVLEGQTSAAASANRSVTHHVSRAVRSAVDVWEKFTGRRNPAGQTQDADRGR